MSQTGAAGTAGISVFADTDGELLEGTPGLSEDFHFHVYFDPDSRDSTLAIREQLKREASFQFQLPPVRERPVGPHRWPIWSVWVDRANFTPAVEWMMRHHGQHSVLVHPNIDDGLADHTDRAMWLGEPRPLKLEVFRRAHGGMSGPMTPQP
jgi:aromatic ring-cleaving dioxygenase